MLKWLLPFVVFTTTTLWAQKVKLTTAQYDNMRTGANVLETILTPKNVNARQFGKLRSLAVDGDVYAQPLYLPQVNVPGKGIHSLLFIATEHDSVYAFDAERSDTTPVWHVNLLPSSGVVELPVSAFDVQCPFISPEIGITSTPVIDRESGTIYVLTRSKRRRGLFSNFEYVQRLHALAITTGQEKSGGPVEIRASVKGIGAGSSGGTVDFNPLRENPRAALLLTNGAVYLTWASSCDVPPYHGWVMAYDRHTLLQLAALNTSPNAGESGIWQSDTGPPADSEGNVYVCTGNGLFDAFRGGGRDYGDSLLKLHLDGTHLIVRGYFTPVNEEKLNSTDGDLGSGGPVLIPAQTGGKEVALVFGGKAGDLYNVEPGGLKGLQRDTDGAPAQRIPLAKGIYSAPAYWHGHLYTFGEADYLKAFAFHAGRLVDTPSSQSTRRSQFSGGTPTVSANGRRDGIVWIVETRAWNEGEDHFVLCAYDALNVARELYSSDANSARDAGGEALRFVTPTVADGHVYVGAKKSIVVYGLLSQ